MTAIVDSLKTRYDAVFQASSNPLFYQNLHHYFDLVEKNQTLKALLDASQNEYAQKYGALWQKKRMSDLEADEAEELTFRVERFNMYAWASMIKVRVYDIIEDYKNDLTPEIDQDPCAVLMLRGMNKINPEYAKISPFKWSKENLRVYNKWYDGKRPMYENHLRQFHLLLLDALEKSEMRKVGVQSPTHAVYFNHITGDFSFDGKSGTFQPTTQECKVLRTLYESPEHQSTYLQLLQAINPSTESVTKTRKASLYAVIGRIKKGIGNSAIRNVRNGYRLVLSHETSK